MDKIKASFEKRIEEEIKNQWHTLKTIYQREYTRQEASKKSGSATSEVYKTKWKFLSPCHLFCAAVKFTTLKALGMSMLQEKPPSFCTKKKIK